MNALTTQTWVGEAVTPLHLAAAEHRQTIVNLEQRIVDVEAVGERARSITSEALAAENKRHADEIARLKRREDEALNHVASSIAQDRASLEYHRGALALIDGAKRPELEAAE